MLITLGDTVELTGVCRHGGINSYRNCMNCWTRKVIQNLGCNMYRKISSRLTWSYWTSKMFAEMTKYRGCTHTSRLRLPQKKKSWDVNCQMTSVACITSHLAYVLVAPSWRVSTLTRYSRFSATPVIYGKVVSSRYYWSLRDDTSQEYISVLSRLLPPKKKEMYMIYDITSTLSLEKRIKAIPWPRRTPHILPLVKTEMNLFFLVKQQIFKNIWRWLQPVAVADAGPINGDSVSWSIPKGDIRPLPKM